MRFKLTDEKRNIIGYDAFRIEALESFDDVNVGDKGGFVSSLNNISDMGWIYDDAAALNKAVVNGVMRGNAIALDRAIVNGEVCDNAIVYGHCVINGTACGNSKVLEGIILNAKSSGKAVLTGKRQVEEDISGKGRRPDPQDKPKKKKGRRRGRQIK